MRVDAFSFLPNHVFPIEIHFSIFASNKCSSESSITNDKIPSSGRSNIKWKTPIWFLCQINTLCYQLSILWLCVRAWKSFQRNSRRHSELHPSFQRKDFHLPVCARGKMGHENFNQLRNEDPFHCILPHWILALCANATTIVSSFSS